MTRDRSANPAACPELVEGIRCSSHKLAAETPASEGPQVKTVESVSS